MRAPTLAAAAVAAVLLLTTDERSYGVVTDGQQMLSVSYALTHGLGLGVSPNFPGLEIRAGGDAVPRYGLGLPLVEAVPMLAARVLRAAVPSAPTLPLFVLVPSLGLAASAWAAARAAEADGATRRGAILAGIALPLATPLWGYAASDLSEPLQAASLAVLVAAAAVLRLEKKAGRGWEIAAGGAAGLALLSKSLLLLPALPLLLAASLRTAGPPRLRRVPLTLFGACVALWAALEFSRFGRLFGGYAGEGFTYSLGDGLLRLLVFPNRGLLFFAPLVVLAPAGFLRLRRREAPLAWAEAISAGSLLGAVAMWWAWDGQVGWGPRLLVPILPALVFLAAAVTAGPAAAAAARSRRETVFAALVLLGVGVNLLGALVPFPGVDAVVASAQPLPAVEGVHSPAASAPYQHLARNPSWSPIRIHARLLAERLRGGDVAGRLSAGALADLDPPLVPRGGLPVLVASPLRFAFWGRTWIAPLPGGADPYDDAAADQELRLRQRTGR